MSIGRHKRKVETTHFDPAVCVTWASLLLICSGAAGYPLPVLGAEVFEMSKNASPFEIGKRDFGLKRYYAAKAQFMAAVTQNPSNQRAYLYLGLCLEALKEWEDAQATYRACFAVDPFSDDGKRAKRLSMELSGYLESRERRAVDTPEDVYRAGMRIQRQALELQERKLRDAGRYVSNNRARGRVRGHHFTPDDLMHRSRQDELSDWQFIRDAHEIYDAHTQEALARGFGVRSAQNVQDAANNLIERLGRKTKNSPALRATGTDLYVQYYRSKNDEDDEPPPADPEIELKARQMKLSESSTAPSSGTRATTKSVSGSMPLPTFTEPPRARRSGGAFPETDPESTEVGPGVTTYD